MELLKRKWDIERLQQAAVKKGGKCLSSECFSGNSKYLWECEKGHQWKASGKKVESETWCPQCSKNYTGSLEQMKQIAAERGGECLSDFYVRSTSKMTWRCLKGHTWQATSAQVKKGSWCGICSGNTRATIEGMGQIASQRGGRCLSKTYVNAHKKLEWECVNGHVWKANANHIKSGTWCPHCTVYYNEETCRATFQQILKKPFPKSRPEWLRSSSGTKLELDGYSENLKIAFEYNGFQHYEKSYFVTDPGHEQRRKDYDDLKISVCAQRGICLIVIHYKTDLLKLPKIIRETLISQGFDIAGIDFDQAIDFSQIYPSQHKIKKLQDFAQQRGGKLLSELYQNARKNLTWMCSEGHIWEATADTIMNRGSWCKICAGHEKHTIGKMNKIAMVRGGKCLSTEYKNAHSKLLWQCEDGHTWQATPHNVKNHGRWCPECNRANMIARLQNYRNKKRGQCGLY